MSKATTPALLERARDYISALDLARRHKLAEFIGVKTQTIRMYHRGKSVPTGKRLLQLHHILSWAGYGDHAWRVDDDSVEMVGRALTFRLISDDDLIEAFKSECDELSRITQMMTGGKHISPASQAIFDQLASVHSWHIKDAQARWNDLRIMDDKDKLVAELANKLQQLLPLVEEISGDRWSAEDRAALRDRAGRGVVLELYNNLGYLCGERHRKQTMAERASKAAASMLLSQQ